jgi:hypothetical protein
MTIDEVIARLTDITTWARQHSSRLGYFAALYRTVTIEVKRGIADGRFENGARMERLDVLFARRYLDAFDAYHRGDPIPRSWRIAFDSSPRWRPIVLQHLLGGINAHINLDLGVAAAAVAPGAEIESLRRDFDEINVLLGGLIAGVQAQIADVSPWIRLLSVVGGSADDVLVNFNLRLARRAAWRVATDLAPLGAADQPATIARVDLAASVIGHLVLRPPMLTSAGLLAIRARETATPARIIDLLTDVHPLPYTLEPDFAPIGA